MDGTDREDEIKRAKHRALYLLERRDHTEHELREKLSKNYAPETVDAAVAYVKEYGYIDDRRYAERYFEYHRSDKSRRQIEQELLYKRGVKKDVLEEALSEAEPADERAIIRSLIEKKHFDPSEADEGDRRRLFQFLARRGFRTEDILAEMRG